MTDLALDRSSNPRVTVVTPAFNVGRYVGEAIDSVLGQSFTEFEYVIVDDGSTDDTLDVVRERVKADPRVRIVKGDHRGLSATRNTGIREASTPYIAYLDGDDRWHPRFLERQVGLLESLPADVGAVFARSRLILENGTPVGFQWPRSGSYDFDDLLIANNPARNGSSLLIRTSCFEDAGGFDEALASVEDLDMWLRIARDSKTPVFWGNKNVLVDLRLRPGSVTRDRTASENALDDLLKTRTAELRRSHPGLAYIRPAAAAFKYGHADGDDSLAERWAAEAKRIGAARVLCRPGGAQLLFWSALSPSKREIVRSLQRATRESIKAANIRLRGGPAVKADA